MTKAEKEREQKREKIRNAYKVFLAHEDAKIVLEDLKDAYYFYDTTFSKDDPDGRFAAYREGQRSVVLDILTILEQLQDESPEDERFYSPEDETQ